MLVHISICSLIGGLSVSTISGVGSAIVLSIQGENQFKYWFIYFLLAFVTITLVTEIIFLNKALELFNTGQCSLALLSFGSELTSSLPLGSSGDADILRPLYLCHTGHLHHSLSRTRLYAYPDSHHRFGFPDHLCWHHTTAAEQD